MYLTATDFFNVLQGKTVDFDTGQGLVKLRGLTVAEVKTMQQRQTAGEVSGIDVLPLLVAHGLVEPELSETDVQRIAEHGSFDLVNNMAQRVMELSAITDTQRKREALDS